MNKTENLKLNVWEKTDPIHAKDFNDNFQTLDSAVQVCSKIAYGSYVGVGKFSSDNPNKLDFAESLGTCPKILFVVEENGNLHLAALKGMAYTVSYISFGNADYTCYFTWKDTGVEWHSKSNAAYQLNNSGSKYYFVAFA